MEVEMMDLPRKRAALGTLCLWPSQIQTRAASSSSAGKWRLGRRSLPIELIVISARHRKPTFQFHPDRMGKLYPSRRPPISLILFALITFPPASERTPSMFHFI